MYKVFVDDKVLCDSRIDDLAIINPVVELAVNTVEQFSFTLPPTHPLQDLIKIRTSIITVYRDNELAFRGVAVSESVDFYRQKTYECEGVLTFLNYSRQRPAPYSRLTVLELLTSYIASHNQQVDDWKKFQIGKVTVTDPNNYISCYTNMNSTMTEIKEDLIDDIGGFLRTRYENGINYIDYLAESPHDATQVIKLGKNLLDYKSNLSSTTIATRVIPLGAQLEEQVIEGLDTRLTIESVNGGIDYIESSLVDTYGIISAAVIFDNVTTAGALMTKGEKYLSDIQFENVTIEATAIDFGYLSTAIQKFRILDKVHIISSAHGMDRWFLLSEMTLNLNEPENDRFKFGMDGVKSLTAQTKTANDSLLKAIEKITPESDLLKMAKEQATALICGTDGGYVVLNVNDDGVPYEILVMDKPTKEQATKVWRWNQNGLGYSNSGYNGPYGLAITMDGKIVADFITAGTMYADRIKGGTLTLGGTNNDNGILRILNRNNEEVGRWDKDGITLPDNTRLLASQIFGGVLTLGGNNNEKALMQILDADNNQIGKWDKDGIAANKGNIAGWNITEDALFRGDINEVGCDGTYYFGEDGLYLSAMLAINEQGIYIKSENYTPIQYEDFDISVASAFPTDDGKFKIPNAYDYSRYDRLKIYLTNIPDTSIAGISLQYHLDSKDPLTDVYIKFINITVDYKKREYDFSKNCYSMEKIYINDASLFNGISGDLIGIKVGVFRAIDSDKNIVEVQYGSAAGIEKVELIQSDGTILDTYTNLPTAKESGTIIDTQKNYIQITDTLINKDGIIFYDDADVKYFETGTSDRGYYYANLMANFSKDIMLHKNTYNNATSTSGAKALYIKSDGTIIASSSSRRYKDRINYDTQNYCYENLYKLNVAEYQYKEEYGGGDLELGLIAEDVAELFPKAATYNSKGQVESWSERVMIPALLKLIQTQNERIKKLEEAVLNGRC